MNYHEEKKITTQHSYGTWKPQEKWNTPLYITKAEGVYFYDENNKRYLDFSSQLMCSNPGHGNKAIIEAICERTKNYLNVAPFFV